MRLERVVRFGFVGAIGITAISMVTFWLAQVAQTNASFDWAQDALLLLAVGVGTWMALMFLFTLIDVFVDEKLEAREGASPGGSEGVNG